AFSLTFALLGTLLFGAALNSSTSDGAQRPFSALNWPALQEQFSLFQAQSSGPNNQEALLAFAFLLILIGYGAKAALFPMHTWLPDGHGQAPSAVSAILSCVLLKLALYIIVRFFSIVNLVPYTNAFAANTLVGFGLLSLVMATPFILNTNKQNRFKRVLA